MCDHGTEELCPRAVDTRVEEENHYADICEAGELGNGRLRPGEGGPLNATRSVYHSTVATTRNLTWVDCVNKLR